VSSFEFLENCCRQVRALRKGVREVLSVFSTHLVLEQNSVQETSTETSLGFYEFHETGRIENHTLLRDVREFISVLSTFMPDLGENRYRISACDAVDQLRVSSKSAQERLFLCYRHRHKRETLSV
jgi:hypothetical protein